MFHQGLPLTAVCTDMCAHSACLHTTIRAHRPSTGIKATEGTIAWRRAGRSHCSGASKPGE
jgi:hypothetical protein